MEYKQFKNISVSRLGMGNMRLPVKSVEGKNVIDYQKGQEMIDYCMEQGINYYDTAYIYHNGESEVFLGEALKKYPRESFYVADKYNIMAEPDFVKQFQNQLERLQMDYIDFYLLHAVGGSTINDFLTNGCIEYFLKQKEAGKIKYLGFSFHGRIQDIEKMVSEHSWDFAQLQLNYYDWKYENTKKEYQILTEHDIPVMVMEPVHGGLLVDLTKEGNDLLLKAKSEQSIPSWSFDFVRSLDNVLVILSGMSNMDQVKDNIHTFNRELNFTSKDKELVLKAAEILHSTVSVPCTACRYCCDDCPIQLEIPDLLKKYNEYKVGGEWRLNSLKVLDEDKRPTACIGCSMCVGHCPQNIDIPRYMQEMADILNK